jgi:hypothetical protein
MRSVTRNVQIRRAVRSYACRRIAVDFCRSNTSGSRTFINKRDDLQSKRVRPRFRKGTVICEAQDPRFTIRANMDNASGHRCPVSSSMFDQVCRHRRGGWLACKVKLRCAVMIVMVVRRRITSLMDGRLDDACGTSRPIHRSTTPAHKASSQVPVNGGAEHPALHMHTILGEPLARKRIGLQAHDSKGGSKAS